MMVFTSAKSRLMMPGMVMISLMPCTAWRRISSAMRNASKKLVPCSTHSIRRSLGITMTVSTLPISSARACSACSMRRFPSKAKGLVTTATVSAPSSLARFATTGAAPLPVPPPNPAVTKTMSAPSSASRIFSVSSSAALRPTSGFAPAPRPFVNFAPSCNFTGAWESFSACKSVFAAMNSTPSTFARIMRLTAFDPPPPAPITFIFAPFCGSSVNETLIPVSFGVMLPPPEIRYCSKFLLSCKKCFQSPGPAAGASSCKTPRARPVENKSNCHRVFGLGNLFAHLRKPTRRGHAYRKLENVLGQFHQAAEFCAAASENDSGGNLRFESGAAQFIAHEHQEFLNAGFDDVRQHPGENRSRRAVAHARDFNRKIFFYQIAKRAGMLALEPLGFWHRRAKANGQIVRHMVSAHGDRRGVPHDSTSENNHVGGTTAHIKQAGAELAFVLREARFSASQRLQNSIVHAHPGAIHSGDDVLSR